MSIIIITAIVTSALTYGFMKLHTHFCVKPTYAEFGRMSKLVWRYDWNFGKTSHGCTRVWKVGERTAHSFSGLWMYKLLMKDRPSQERIIEE